MQSAEKDGGCRPAVQGAAGLLRQTMPAVDTGAARAEVRCGEGG